MTTIKEIILKTDFELVAKEIKFHYGDEHLQTVKTIYLKLRKLQSKNNKDNMVIL